MKKLVAFTTGAALVTLTACGGGSASDSGDGSLAFAAPLAQTTLDPDLLPISQMVSYLAPMYDTLTHLSGDETVEPRLATDWESGEDDEGPYLDLSLREGLEFDDGTRFTSATVAANITRSQELEGSTLAQLLAGVTVDETGELEVRIRNDSGVGALPRLLAGPAGMMISDQAISEGADLTATEAGIGPFDLDTVQPNRVTYTANAEYWDEDAAAVNTLEISYLADDAKLNAVRSGEIDITILPDDMVASAEAAGYGVRRSLGAENYTFSFNTEIAPFDDPQVREAVNIAIDRQAICDGVLAGSCTPTGQIMGAGTAAFDQDLGLDNFPHEVDRARQLIADAGAEGANVEIVTVAGNSVFEQLATAFQHQLQEIGLAANVLPLAPPQVVSRFTVDQNVAIAFGATGNAFDPSESLDRYVLPDGLYNPGGFTEDAVVDAAAEALRETDQDARTDMYRDISSMVGPESFLVPVLTPETAYVISESIDGWENPWAPSYPSFRGVSG